MERPFHLALGLRPLRPAGPGPEAVVRGEGQEARVVDRLVVLVALHHHLEVVVQAGGGHAAQVREGGHVLPQRRVEVLADDEVQVLAPRVAQQVAEQLHAAWAFLGKGDGIRGIIHLRLCPRCGLETDHRRLGGRRPQLLQPPPHRRVTARKAALPQLLPQPLSGQVGIALQQIPDDAVEGRQATARPGPRRGRGGGGSLVPCRGHLVQDVMHHVPRHVQLLGDPPLRQPLAGQADDVIATAARFSSGLPAASWVSAAAPAAAATRSGNCRAKPRCRNSSQRR